MFESRWIEKEEPEHRVAKDFHRRGVGMRGVIKMISMRTLAAAIAVLLLSSPAWAQGEATDASMNLISTFDVEEKDDGTWVRIRGNAEPTFSVFRLADPPRLFVDISNSKIDGEPKSDRVNNGVVSRVSLLEFADSSQTVTRVIIGFDQAAHYDVRAEGQDVVVFVDGKGRSSDQPVADVSRYQREIQERDQQLAQTQQELERYQRQVHSGQSQVTRSERELESTRDRLADAEKELAQLRVRLQSADGSQRVDLERRIQDENNRVQSLQSDIELREKQLQALTTQLEELQGRVQVAQREREDALERARRTERERDAALARAQEKENESQQAQARARQLESTLADARKELQQASSSQTDMQQQLQTLRSQASSSSAEVQRRTAELEAAQRRETQLREQLQTLRSAVESGDRSQQSALESLQAESSQLNEQLQARQQELARARVQEQQAASQRQALESSLAQRDQEIQRLRAQVAQADNRRAQEQEVASSASQERERALAQAIERERQRVQALEQARSEEEARLRGVQDATRSEQAQLAEVERTRKEQEARLAQVREQLAAAQTDLGRAQSQSTNSDGRVARAVAVHPNDRNTVRGIRLETQEGRSRIVVELDRPGRFQAQPRRDGRAVIVLSDVELPPELERTLSSRSQGGAVRFVSSFKDDDGSVRLEAELGDRMAENNVRQQGNTLVWEFAPQVAQAPSQRQMVDTARPTQGESFTANPPGYPRVVTDPTRVSSVPGMSRRRITIDLRGADIQNVLRLLATEGGVNIIAGEGVGGTVTMRLRSVPLDEVFLTVLQSLSLGFERRGNVIRVAPQSRLMQEEQARADERRRRSLDRPLEVVLIPVNYATASEMVPQVQGLLTPRGNVSVDSRTNMLIVKDIAENIDSIRALLERLDSQVPQVLIEARIVETNDTFTKELGIQWGGDMSFSQANGNPTGLIFPSVLGVAGGATDGQTPVAGTSSNPNFAINLPASVGTGSGGAIGLTMGSVGGGVNINLRLSALETQGHAKIISAPKILTLDNSPAQISQGTSIPISVVSAAGVQTVFVDATLELSVTPHVTPDGNVQMRISATKNEPDFQNTGARGDPTIIRKEAQTELLVKDGETTVIGGIYTRNTGSSISAVPFFHKIPILGFFFRNTSTSDRREELLIFITPKIVNRAESLGTAQNP